VIWLALPRSRKWCGDDPSLRKEAIRFLFLEGPWQIFRTLMSDFILGEVLLSARHIVEIATLLFRQTAKREKLYPKRQHIGWLFSPHSPLIADRSCRRSDSYSPAPLAIASENDRSRTSDASNFRLIRSDRTGREIKIDRLLLVCADAIVDRGETDLRPCSQFKDSGAGTSISLPMFQLGR
jgi:hypothetical protein